jgi:hypothetical protein
MKPPKKARRPCNQAPDHEPFYDSSSNKAFGAAGQDFPRLKEAS